MLLFIHHMPPSQFGIRCLERSNAALEYVQEHVLTALRDETIIGPSDFAQISENADSGPLGLDGRPIITGGLLGFTMVVQEFGARAKAVVYAAMHRSGIAVPRNCLPKSLSRLPSRQVTMLRLKAINLRVLPELPAYISRRLISSGSAAGGLLRHILMETMKRMGLHKRGLDLLSSLLSSRSGNICNYYLYLCSAIY